ncbi:MAG: mandelate racemase/muconate lactonizing enzyme family protein [Proteobacteria bacterium]|nr:mandelate racemase/muconate lactonizing enzyme family protein [Pseudomonadota bacterium]
MVERVESVECFVVSIPREVPYLGPLRAGEAINPKGYFVRAGNRTVYPAAENTVLVKIVTASGAIGWGEAFGVIAPRAVTALIDDLLGPFVVGRDPRQAGVIHDDLYDMMRVRGHFGGYYLDALAGIDIALWDLCGKLAGRPLAKLLGQQRHATIPAYVSGLPRATVPERAALAREWQGKGFSAFKFAAAVSDAGEVAEMQALRGALGKGARIAVDLHWRYTADAAIKLIARLAPHDLWFAEAPCAPEDMEGQSQVTAAVATPVALGEELRTVHECRPRLQQRCMAIVQPEMGHTGITEFLRIARLAESFHCQVMPHATIGIGLFLAASLHAAATLADAPWHEYQHSIFDKNLRYVTGDMACSAGRYSLPTGPGLGVEPAKGVWKHVVR